MDHLLVASSPVEIEAKALEIGLKQPARDLALALFHDLTNRLGQAARSMPEADPDWPKQRFYFAESHDPEIAALLEGLQGRPDFIEIAGATSSDAGPAGLFVQEARSGFTAILVKHESHEGLPSGRTRQSGT